MKLFLNALVLVGLFMISEPEIAHAKIQKIPAIHCRGWNLPKKFPGVTHLSIYGKPPVWNRMNPEFSIDDQGPQVAVIDLFYTAQADRTESLEIEVTDVQDRGTWAVIPALEIRLALPKPSPVQSGFYQAKAFWGEGEQKITYYCYQIQDGGIVRPGGAMSGGN